MIAAALALAKGAWLPLALAASVGLLAWQWHERGKALAAAELREAMISETARRNAAAVDAVTRDGERNVRAMAADAKRTAARAKDADRLEEALRHVQVTRDCAGSPAVRAGLDELRLRAAARAGGGAAGPAGHPRGTSDLPGRAGNPPDGGDR